MKGFRVIFILMGSLFFLFSCTKDEPVVPNDLLSDEAVTARGPHGDVITLTPSGGDDTEQIQNALDAAGPGDVVYLEEGLYRIQPIFVYDFDGTFKGAGKRKTIIEPYGSLNFPDQDFSEYSSPDNLYPFLINFRRGNIRLSDMSLRIPASTPISWNFTLGGGSVPINSLGGIVLVTGETANSVVECVAFKGASGNFYQGYNVLNHYYIESPLSDPWNVSGTHAVYSCSFRTAASGAFFGPFGDAKLVVGGSPSKGNSFKDVLVGLEVYDFKNSQVEVSYNRITNPGLYGMSGKQGSFIVPDETSNAVYKHNKITVSGNADGALFVDLGAQKTMNLKFSNNSVQMDDTGGGVFAFRLRDALLKNNRFRGAGLAGIYTNGSSGCTLLGNNLQQLEAGVAGIWLMANTSGNTVVGGPNASNVLDQGTGNIITGVNNMNGNPPGPAVMQALQDQHELWHPWKGPR